MIKHSSFGIILPCLSVISTPSVFAAAESKEDTIVVSSSRTHRSIPQMAQTSWVIESHDIEQQVNGGKEFKDILAQLIPGMDVSSQGRTNHGMNIRGRSIAVMIDGVRLNSSRSDSRQLDSIDPFNIERIEVISGATSLYGGGSTGGLINIVTKKGQEGGQVDLQFGAKSGLINSSDHDENIAAAVSGGNENIKGRLSVSYQRYGGWFDGKHNQVLIDNTQTGLQYSDRLDVMGTGTLNIDEHQQLQLTTQYYKSKADGKHGINLGKDFSAVLGKGSAHNASGLDSDRVPGTTRHLISLQYSNTDFLGQDLVTQLFYRDESFAFYPFPTLGNKKGTKKKEVISISASEQKTDFYGGKFTLNSQPVKNLSLTYGFDADHEKFSANQQFFDLKTAQEHSGMKLKNAYNVGRYPGYSITNLAPFLQANYDINSIFTVSSGLRYQYTKNKIDDFIPYNQQQAIATSKILSADAVPGGTTSYNNYLFNAGILANLPERQQVWFNFSQGFELPDVGKYYGSGNYGKSVNGHIPLVKSINVNDSKLKGIKVNSYELGWRYNGDNLRTQIAAYYSLSDISINIIKKDMRIEISPDKRRIYGIEGAVDYLFDNSDWTAGTTFNILKSETQKKDKWEKLSIETASPSKMTAYVNWAPDDWEFRLQSQQTFDISDNKGKKLDGYNTIDFLGTYHLPVGKISFSIENLLDKDYTSVWGQRASVLYSPAYGAAELYNYKGRGRTFGLSYSATF
ncbi:TonB-dependent siderophore receptor [Xenorhabdus sp. 42]|uniref:TonB-dependent siderophore receptor n=1 Tax=Xenorhabdus szentirmaii TaxID=290112 RepID=UPI0019AC8E27|nr:MULTISPECIES: TonB-dependent siderophore receptor [unclassified Xenorhabdus]MBD2793669.1 TonB-dependent siderophore receptor [Xenorhabdus sp. CUL]MBD2819966.1 TonB-dependent siderophore receptor [Xenorhabdus sp. 42]MBD2826557.1 TonB-dependent siderophore receptor [Xenorhabdus sp. 5]